MTGRYLEARPVQELLCKRSQTVVGWLYRWNTGEHTAYWLVKTAVDDIEYRSLPNSPP